MSLSRRTFIENSAFLIATVGTSDAAWSDSRSIMFQLRSVSRSRGFYLRPLRHFSG